MANSRLQAIPISVRVPGWATGATLDGKPVANGTIVKTECKGTCAITLRLNPEVRFEFGWGLGAGETPELISYSAAGATVPSNTTSLSTVGGASIVPSMGAKARTSNDIRSGSPGETTMAVLDSWIFSAGHSIEAVAFSFQYVAGYGPTGNPDGPTLSLVALDADSGAELQTFYTSPVLNKYSFDHFTGYSPAIQVDADKLNFVHTGSIKLSLKFSNNKQNLQIAVDEATGLGVKVTWGSANGRPAGKPGTPSAAATNAVSILRGPLLYSLPLDEKVAVVKTWVRQLFPDVFRRCFYFCVAISDIPPHMRRVPCSSQRPCLLGADWCLQSDVFFGGFFCDDQFTSSADLQQHRRRPHHRHGLELGPRRQQAASLHPGRQARLQAPLRPQVPEYHQGHRQVAVVLERDEAGCRRAGDFAGHVRLEMWRRHRAHPRPIRRHQPSDLGLPVDQVRCQRRELVRWCGSF